MSLTDELAEALFAVRLSANIPVDRHAMYARQPDSIRAVFVNEAAAILADLDESGWEMVRKREPSMVLVFDADHDGVIGSLTFGRGDGEIHDHGGLGFHGHAPTARGKEEK